MGTSNWQNISYNIDLVRKLDPQTILDAGVGFGRWGILFREFLEIWDDGRYDGNWKRRIDGVEIHEAYIKDYHRYFYDEVIIGDILGFLEKTERRYDLINLGDIIEHFEKKDGFRLIELALQKSRYVLINVPIGKNWEQTGTAENPYEAHRSIWYNNDFTRFRHHIMKCFRDNAMRDFSVILISKNKIRFTKKYGRFFWLKSFLKHRLGLRKIIEAYEKRKN
ncbi:MAG: class I SAM-dependent methyltransferase [Ignavibacteria bacterium]|nr:class I SAM-dependent methyltransferase [Ignavibacteria bacterium]